jgi:outer membrane lipoprotein-sorting protein
VKRFTAYQYTFLIGTLLLSSCSSKPQAGGTNSQPNEQIISSTPPFKTKEPQHYQAVRTITFTDPSGAAITRKTTIARSEVLRREETENGDSGTLVFLESDNGRFVLLPGAKMYSEITDASGIDPTEFESSPERLLHPETVSTTYQKLGSEMVSGRQTTKYRVAVNTATGTDVSASDTLIWVDESLGMPVKSETTAGDGSHVVVELSNIVLAVDKNLFNVPEDYIKVNATALRQRLSQKQVR